MARSEGGLRGDDCRAGYDFIDPDDITEDDVLTDWEKDFLASIGYWDGDLTDRQQEKLDEIEAEIPMRLEVARQGRWPINR